MRPLSCILLACVAGGAPVHAEKPDCSKTSIVVTKQVTARPDATLGIVKNQTAANPSCACEIVKAAIMATEAYPDLVAQIVAAAAGAAPDQLDVIATCALAVAPDALPQIKTVLAKLDPPSENKSEDKESDQPASPKKSDVVVKASAASRSAVSSKAEAGAKAGLGAKARLGAKEGLGSKGGVAGAHATPPGSSRFNTRSPLDGALFMIPDLSHLHPPSVDTTCTPNQFPNAKPLNP